MKNLLDKPLKSAEESMSELSDSMSWYVRASTSSQLDGLEELVTRIKIVHGELNKLRSIVDTTTLP